MKKLCLFALLLAVGCLAFPQRSPAPITVRPGEGATYTAPGSEEAVPNEKDAQTQFDAALAKENKGDLKAALTGYQKTVRRFQKSTVAATAQYKIGQILEKRGDLDHAATAYETLIHNYPHSTDFNNALEGEFRLGDLYLEGAKQVVLGVKTLPSRDRAAAIFQVIVQNAPYSRLAPVAQFKIGQTHERENDFKGAIASYQVVVDKYPTETAASDALYQIAYCYMRISRSGSYDRIADMKAKESFEDFLSAYPTSEKAPQAREDLEALTSQQTGGSLQIADYYYKQKMFKAAVVYYNDVIRQQPSSPDSAKAQAKLNAIRAKTGDKYFTDTTPANVAVNGPVQPKLGDGRLQAQTDTAKRSDYVGPPVSAPTPPPVLANPASSLLPNGAGGTAPIPATQPPDTGPRPEPTPPPVPEGEQPNLPTQ